MLLSDKNGYRTVPHCTTVQDGAQGHPSFIAHSSVARNPNIRPHSHSHPSSAVSKKHDVGKIEPLESSCAPAELAASAEVEAKGGCEATKQLSKDASQENILDDLTIWEPVRYIAKRCKQ